MELSKKVGYIKGLMAGLKIDTTTPEGQVLSAMSDLLEEMAEEIEVNAEIIDNITEYIDEIEAYEDYYDEIDDDETEADDSDYSESEEEHDELQLLEGLSDQIDRQLAAKQDTDEKDTPPSEEEDVYYECTCPVCKKTFGVEEEQLESGSIVCPNCDSLLEFEV